MLKVGIIGTTIWGITLSIILAEKGIDVGLWARTEKEADDLRKSGPDQEETPTRTFPDNILITHEMEAALDEAKAVVLVVEFYLMSEQSLLVKFLVVLFLLPDVLSHGTFVDSHC